jgi:hypothetical protein
MIAFLFGAIGKIYDDITDLHIYIHPHIDLTLRICIAALYAAIAYNDFSFALITTIFAITTNGVDSPYWSTFALIGGLLCITAFILDNTAVDWILFSGVAIGGAIIANIEDSTFPEETSIAKIASRIIGVLIISIILLFPIDINYIRKLLEICIGGLVISIPTEIFMLY